MNITQTATVDTANLRRQAQRVEFVLIPAWAVCQLCDAYEMQRKRLDGARLEYVADHACAGDCNACGQPCGG